ncbi:hypothetical protein AARI_14070 [Glutamicibacter arilaitensis Re117]|uniref:Uncharacterized protein n=1 Tax=Glutamicibacter arilaitensis (strain DSM 16368 / CIP 108037 / IAM 15318 / JCM 13566 / NCIMB 14258 / Re117) TaxID=861360 RepID=A0ABM9PWH2_GLUAR|nr:hypothetical protein AARI_14070 [Glutamicibacter arilaitensis Re117]
MESIACTWVEWQSQDADRRTTTDQPGKLTRESEYRDR